jgi:hypothetical protein
MQTDERGPDGLAGAPAWLIGRDGSPDTAGTDPSFDETAGVRADAGSRPPSRRIRASRDARLSAEPRLRHGFPFAACGGGASARELAALRSSKHGELEAEVRVDSGICVATADQQHSCRRRMQRYRSMAVAEANASPR